MRESHWKAVLRKSISACIAAMEVYNKPVMPHREEAFAILAVNAWELLLKARILRDNGNKLRSIQVLVPIKKKDGTDSTRFRIELNRAGNPRTITLAEAIRRVEQAPAKRLDPACAANLWSLVEIRNNAVHFVNEDREFARQVYEAGSACLRNFAAVVADWFDSDLSKHRFMILPLSFEGAGESLAVPVRQSRHQENLKAYLSRASEEHPAREGSPYAASIRVETRIVGNRAKDALAVRLGAGPGAPVVSLSDEEIAAKWPHEYAQLVGRVKGRTGAKLNHAFHDAMKAIADDRKLVYRRNYDPRNPTKGARNYYSDAAVDAICAALEKAREGRPGLDTAGLAGVAGPAGPSEGGAQAAERPSAPLVGGAIIKE